jgi:hypothetical protein
MLTARTILVAAAVGVAGGALLAFAMSLGKAVPGVERHHRVGSLEAQTAPQPPSRTP